MKSNPLFGAINFVLHDCNIRHFARDTKVCAGVSVGAIPRTVY